MINPAEKLRRFGTALFMKRPKRARAFEAAALYPARTPLEMELLESDYGPVTPQRECAPASADPTGRH